MGLDEGVYNYVPSNMPEIVFVLAGSLRQFDNWIAKRGGRSVNKEFRYVTGPETLRGVIKPKIRMIGTYWQNPAYEGLSEITTDIGDVMVDWEGQDRMTVAEQAREFLNNLPERVTPWIKPECPRNQPPENIYCGISTCPVHGRVAETFKMDFKAMEERVLAMYGLPPEMLLSEEARSMMNLSELPRTAKPAPVTRPKPTGKRAPIRLGEDV